jgi:hypothetical protein
VRRPALDEWGDVAVEFECDLQGQVGGAGVLRDPTPEPAQHPALEHQLPGPGQAVAQIEHVRDQPGGGFGGDPERGPDLEGDELRSLRGALGPELPQPFPVQCRGVPPP